MDLLRPSLPAIAVIEDDEDLRANLLLALRSKNYSAWGTTSAEEFYRAHAACPADIVLIDLGLPGEDGFNALVHLRKNDHLGIIVITARGGTENRIAGLQAGADHYFIKPIDMRELVAVIETLWRRIKPRPMPSIKLVGATPSAANQQPNWVLLPNEGVLLFPSGKKLALTERENTLVAKLLRVQGEVIDKNSLHVEVFPDSEQIEGHRIDVILSRLRQKAMQEINETLPIRTIFGKGFVFTLPTQLRVNDPL